VGLDASGPWGWVVALGLALVGTVVLGIVLPRRRTQEDQALWSELTSS